MDLGQEELQFLSIPGILRESVAIPRQSPKAFCLITLTLIFPLSFAILAHSLFTHPIIAKIEIPPKADGSPTRREWTLLLIFVFCYLIFLFVFSLLSTAAVVFTVASLYTKKPVSFSSTISAIPKVFKRLFITFLWVSLMMVLDYSLFLILVVVSVVASDNNEALLALLSSLVIMLLLTFVHSYITALWHLASVVSVLEPIYGLAAMKKSYELLRGKTWMAFQLVLGYLWISTVITLIFGYVVFDGENKYGVPTKISVGGLLVGFLVIVNLVGLLVQSVFYYVTKSYHHQGIGKSALHEHLGGYLGEYVPLKSDIQMENLDI